MGPSGSGKTTLLDLLAGRKTVGKTEGSLTFGGAKPTPAFLRRYTGYVEQFGEQEQGVQGRAGGAGGGQGGGSMAGPQQGSPLSGWAECYSRL